jgi:hypothetical protein
MTEQSPEQLNLIDDDEVGTLLDSLQIQPDGLATEAEAQLLFNWVQQIRISNILLEFLLDGTGAVVGFHGDQPRVGGMEQAVARHAVMAAERLLGGTAE